jgi:mannose-6-phosphate isomerase-like protein (cupin superfamily)/quercetin dioxygenase-like cupin family protein
MGHALRAFLPNATIPRMTRYTLLLAATLLAAQAAAPEVEITAEPHHHLTLENKSVRVFKVDVSPHSETLMHWHRHDYFAVNLGTAEVVNSVKDKPPVTVKLQDGQTTFSPASFAHIARNSSDQPFRNVTIEILEDDTLRHATSPWVSKKATEQNEDRALLTFPGGTQQILFVKDAIRVSEFELQPGAIVPMQHHAGPQLLVAVTDANLGSKPPSHLKSGDSKWLPANDSYTITNMSATPAKFVTLEFP